VEVRRHARTCQGRLWCQAAILATAVFIIFSLSACQRRVRPQAPFKYQVGEASYYGGEYHDKRTASGEKYNMNALTAAHRTLPFNTMVRVENLKNKKKLKVRINDRGPAVEGRIIDLSRKVARKLG
jgi:rare lipoprotein A